MSHPHHRLTQIVAQLQPHLQPHPTVSAITSASVISNNKANSDGKVEDEIIYDCIVVGCGAHGISTLYHLARNAAAAASSASSTKPLILGLERYTLPHANGSSHGETRITRLAYWEHPSYVPLLRRSFELFREMEQEIGVGEKDLEKRLFLQTGSLDIGHADESTFSGSLASCLVHNLPHTIYDTETIKARFPAWQHLPQGYKACYQPEGGMLFPERVVAATLQLARKYGAEVKENTEVVDIIPISATLTRIVTSPGASFLTHHVILSPGAWLPTLLQKSTLGKKSERFKKLAGMLKPERQVVTWYDVDERKVKKQMELLASSSPSSSSSSLTPSSSPSSLFHPSLFPVWIATFEKYHYYGFPLLSSAEGCPTFARGLKIGRYHHAEEQIESEEKMNDVKRRGETTERDRTYTDRFMTEMFSTSGVRSDPSDSAAVLKMQTCIFTNTPDEHFIVDPAPDASYPTISMISACSGHGFKFSSVMGEIMAEFVRTKGEKGVEKIEARGLPVKWLDAGRLLGDRPPMQVLDPHLAIAQKKL